MSDLPFSDREVERVLAGQQPHGRPDLAEVAYFVARLRALGDFERPPPIGPALRAQLEATEAHRPVRPSVRPYASAHGYGDAGRDDGVQVLHLDARRRAKSGNTRVRWRLVGVAAAVVMVLGVGSALVIGLQGMRQSPEVETETVVDSDDDSVPSTEEPAPKPTEATTTSTGGVPAEGAEDAEESEAPSQPAEAPAEASNEPAAQDGSQERTPVDDGADQVPEWMPEDWQDYWPDECREYDFDCFCERYDDRYRYCPRSDHDGRGP